MHVFNINLRYGAEKNENAYLRGLRIQYTCAHLFITKEKDFKLRKQIRFGETKL